MKKIIEMASNTWYNLKLALYATMVIILAVAVPVLSYLELSHSDATQPKTEEVAKNSLANPGNVINLQKQS